MYVESLELTNFKSIKHKSLKLSKCNVIYGAPATGKTSIVLGLAHAFGLNAFEERIVDYVKDGESEFSIKMKAHHKKKPLEMLIRAGEKGSKKELSYDGEEFSNSNVIEKLRELYSPDLVLYSSIALQDQTSSVLFEAPSERLNRLKSLLGMDEISGASEKIGSDIQGLKAKISTLKTEISALESTKFDKMDIPDYPHLEENLQEEFNLMKIKHETYLTELRNYEIKLDEERKRKANFDRHLQEFKFYLNKKNELISKIEKLNNKLLEYKPKIKDMIDVASIDKELSVTRSDYQTAANKLKFAKLGKCSECGREFKGDIKALENQCETLKERGLVLKAKKEESDVFNQDALRFQTLYKSERSNLDSAEAELKAMIETVDPGEFLPITYEKPEFDSGKYDSLKTKIAVHDQRIQEINRATEFNEKQLQREQQNSQLVLDKKKILIDLGGELSVLEEGKSILDKEFTPFLLEGGLSFVEEEMNNFFTRVHSSYRVHMKKDKKSVSFFYSKRKDHLAPIGTLSGHERKIMSVAFRVALTAMQDFGIMVMDEIDGSADDERSLSLFKNLMELDFEQIFIISHKSTTVRYLVNECDATLINMNEENFV